MKLAFCYVVHNDLNRSSLRSGYSCRDVWLIELKWN